MDILMGPRTVNVSKLTRILNRIAKRGIRQLQAEVWQRIFLMTKEEIESIHGELCGWLPSYVGDDGICCGYERTIRQIIKGTIGTLSRQFL